MRGRLTGVEHVVTTGSILPRHPIDERELR